MIEKTVLDVLEEESKLQVIGIKVGFNKIVPGSVNYVDSHSTIPPFGTRWGRGVIVKGNGLDAIIGSYGSTHAQLKKSMQDGESTNGTFYWGYDTPSKTVYFEYGSDRTFSFEDGNILNAIMNGLKQSPGPLRGFTR